MTDLNYIFRSCFYFVTWPPPLVEKQKTTHWSNWAWPWRRQSCLRLKTIDTTDLFIVSSEIEPLTLNIWVKSSSIIKINEKFGILKMSLYFNFIKNSLLKWYQLSLILTITISTKTSSNLVCRECLKILMKSRFKPIWSWFDIESVKTSVAM